MPTTTIILAHNPGKFAVKDSYTGTTGERVDSLPFPAVIAPLGQVDDLGLGKGTKMLTATVGGATYMGGAHATRHALANRSVSIERLDATSPIYPALVQMSFQHTKLAARGNGKMPNIVLATALPAGWKNDATVEALERHMRVGLKGLVTIKSIYIRSEQASVVYSELLDDDGQIQRQNVGLSKGLVGVADLGGGDLNTALLENLEAVPDSATTDPLGSYEVIEPLARRAGIQLPDAEARLRRYIKGEVDPLAAALLKQYSESVVDKLTKTWRDYRNSATAFLFAGGTSIWIKDSLIRAFGPKARVVAKPQQAVAIGLYRFAVRQIAKNK